MVISIWISLAWFSSGCKVPMNGAFCQNPNLIRAWWSSPLEFHFVIIPLPGTGHKKGSASAEVFVTCLQSALKPLPCLTKAQRAESITFLHRTYYCTDVKQKGSEFVEYFQSCERRIAWCVFCQGRSYMRVLWVFLSVRHGEPWPGAGACWGHAHDTFFKGGDGQGAGPLLLVAAGP